MEEYIKNLLQAGIIHPSSSPAGTGFWWPEAKDDIAKLVSTHCMRNKSPQLPLQLDFPSIYQHPSDGQALPMDLVTSLPSSKGKTDFLK